MNELTLTISLLADTELGTGLGTETLDGLLPRDAEGRPIIPASHLKGLLRERLEALGALRGWPDGLLDALLGTPGEGGGDGTPSRLRLTDASPRGGDPGVITITRTAIGAYGTAQPGSLRTVEALSAGTTLTAKAWVDDTADGALDLLARLGLMAIDAVGGGRTRGAGLCRIVLGRETRTPGTLLREADDRARRWRPADGAGAPLAGSSGARRLPDGEPVWLRLIFRANSAICCPETPINGSTNHIRSGPVIPASALQGAILTLLNERDSGLASACYADRRFRAWPLVPVCSPESPSTRDRGSREVPFGVRVDLTHRMSKLQGADGRHEVRDSAIEPYHWSEVAGGSPLKSSDGVLRRSAEGEVSLWRAVDMPRQISSHSVHASMDAGGRRGLFSVEALAPMVFSGLLSLPPEAAAMLKEILDHDPVVSLGKARSIRGSGTLELQPLGALDAFLSGALPAALPGCVYVVQSPLALPDDYGVGRAETALQYLAERAGWGRVLLDTLHDGYDVPRTAATCGVRFGWSRHRLGQLADDRHARLQARRVILPGAVLVLEAPLADPAAKLLAGLGDGRECGFGALIPHPGIANADPYRPHPEPPRLASHDAAGRQALELFRRAGESGGPTPSQIAAVGRRVGKDADAYLKRQMERGQVRHWHRWKPVFGDVETLVRSDADTARRVLRAWQDLAIIHRDAEEGR